MCLKQFTHLKIKRNVTYINELQIYSFAMCNIHQNQLYKKEISFSLSS